MTKTNYGGQLAPPDATDSNLQEQVNPVSCWYCSFYNPKVFGGDDTQGKCFRDHPKVWWVYGSMTCPRFNQDKNMENNS